MVDVKKTSGRVVVSSYEEARNNLKESLVSLRLQGEAGKELARNLLSEESKKSWYKESKKSYAQIVSDLENFVHSSGGSSSVFGGEIMDSLKDIYDYHKKTGEAYDESTIDLIGKILDGQAQIFPSGGRNYGSYDNYNHTSLGEYDHVRYGYNCGKSSLALDTLNKFIDILPLEEQEKYLKMALETTHFVEDRHTYYTRGQRLQEGANPAKHDKFECIRSYSKTGHLSDTKDLYSCKKYLEPLLIKVFSKTHHADFVNSMIVPLIHHGYDLKAILPKQMQDEYLTEENIKNIVTVESIKNNKAYLGEVLLSLHKNGVSFSQQSVDYCISMMSDLERKRIPLVRESGKMGFSSEGMPIQDVFNDITSQHKKDLLKNVYKDGILDGKRIQELKKMYSSDVLWQGIEKDCLNAEFINSHLDDLSDILDNDGIMYVLHHVNIVKDGKKLDEGIVKKLSIYDIATKGIPSSYDGYDRSIERVRIEVSLNKQIAKLVIQKIDLKSIPSKVPGYAIYDALHEAGMLDKEHREMFSPSDLIRYYTDSMSSIHSSAGTPLDYYGHERYKKMADNIMDTNVLPVIKKHIPGYIDTLLQSGDLNKIKDIIRTDEYWKWIYRTNMRKEQIDSFIDNVLASIDTQEDLQFLEKYVLGKNFYRDFTLGFLYSNLPITYIKYRLYGEYPSIENNIPITASMYKDMIAKGMVSGTQKQPQIIDDSQLRIPNIDKIISLFEQKTE